MDEEQQHTNTILSPAEDMALDIVNYNTKIDFWRIQFTEKEFFPCNGIGFIAEGEASIIYDGLGRRIGSSSILDEYIRIMGGKGNKEHDNNYYILCQISYEELQEMKKINLALET